MCSVQRDYENRLHPKLRSLEQQFHELLTRSFDPETLVRLMKMEVETAYPGLTERDQAQIVNIVVEHMRLDERFAPLPAKRPVSNVVPFPGGRLGSTRLKRG